MKFFVGLLVVALFNAVSCGHVSVQMPYGSPAGVTYVDGSYHAGLAAGPVAYSAPLTAAAPVATTAYTAAPVAAAAYSAAPVATAAYSAAPVATAAYSAAPVAAATYAAPVAAATYAAVPTVHHVPGVADVPVTRYEAQPGVLQKVVDVAKPAVQTRKFEIRRPAIQKQFFDIEERVVVRPAGSAVVELDEPVSRTQKGPAVIQPAAVSLPTYGVSVSPSPIGIAPVQTSPILSTPGIASTPAPAPVFEQDQQQQSFSDDDSVAIDNPDVAARSSLARASGPSTPAPYPQYERPQPVARQEIQSRSQPQPQLFSARASQSYETATTRSFGASAAYSGPQTFSRSSSEAQAQAAPQPSAAPQSYSAEPAPQSYSSALPQAYSAAPLAAAQYTTSQTFGPAPLTVAYPTAHAVLPQARFAESAIASARDYQAPAVNQANQQRLIELLTARGGVTEIGYARSSSAGESGQVRGRVVSATPAPAYSEPAGERVNTRRVVVSRPIETLQEVEVAEPVTKFERIQVNQPTVIKTARQDVLRVPTSFPVYGKALAPVAQAALPYALPVQHQPWQ